MKVTTLGPSVESTPDSAAALERALGSAWGDGVFSYRRAVARDEREAYPRRACAELDRWGLASFYVPRRWGGRLTSFPELFDLARRVARRDLTVAVAHFKTVLGTLPVWLAGSVEQQRRLAGLVQSGAAVCYAMTEEDHGSDVLACRMRATRSARGFRLNGDKVLINGAGRSRLAVIFARTDPAGGARGFSLFLLDRQLVEAARLRIWPRFKTHGIRAAEISGLGLDAVEVGGEALIGGLGSGLEVSLLTLQITRLLVAAMALGSADTALSLAWRAARQRGLTARGWVRARLLAATLDLRLCEAVVGAAARAIHVTSEELSVVSAITKAWVPRVVAELFEELAPVIGEDAERRCGGDHGVFQKFHRDQAILGLFDGSTEVNLSALAQQLPQLLASSGDEHRGARLFRLAEPLPELDAGRLTLSSRGRNAAVDHLTACRRRLAKLADRDPAARRIAELAQAVDERLTALAAALAALRQFYGRRASRQPRMFQLAARYATLHAACCALAEWLEECTVGDSLRDRGEGLILCLERLLASPTTVASVARSPLGDRLLAQIEGRIEDDAGRDALSGEDGFKSLSERR